MGLWPWSGGNRWRSPTTLNVARPERPLWTPRTELDIVSRNRMMVFTGGANEPLAREVAEDLGIQLGKLERSAFADGEIYVRPQDSVRGADCFVIQSHCKPINDNIMEQLITIDALKRASARRITAVVPYFGYSRQDKK